MKQILSIVLLSLTASLAIAATAVGPMNYQGRLLDNAGIPVTGSYNVVVKIYNDPAAGTLKYQETKNAVPVDDGVYSFKIGTGPKTGGDSLWDVDLWQLNLNDLYLEVVVNGETLTPRHELTSAPHAFTSTLALHANTVGYLGGQSTDNVLVAICKSGKGVWLDIADKCLGPGADFSVAAVGGSVVNISTLHSGTNFTGIDLTNANIAGIDFGGANLSQATLKSTTYNSNGVKAANLSGGVWDGALDVNAAVALFNGSIASMTVKNMNLSKWDLSGIAWPNYKWFSAAELSACPNKLVDGNLTNQDCIEQYAGSGRYMTRGIEANFGLNSAVMGTDGSLSTDVDISGKNIQASSFFGVKVALDFSANWMEWVNFERATLVGNSFINNSRMQTFYMDGVRMDGVLFYGQSNESWNNWSLKGASLNNVIFQTTGTNVPHDFNFTGAHLSNVYFPEVEDFNFTDAVLDSISLDVDPSSIAAGKDPATNFDFSNAKLTGNLRLDLSANGSGCSLHTACRAQLDGVQVYNATFLFDPPGNLSTGGISKADFSDCSIVRTEFATTALRTKFTNCTFREVIVKANANFGNATFTSVTGRDDQIWWEAGAICPNNTAVTNSGFSGASPYGCFGKW